MIVFESVCSGSSSRRAVYLISVEGVQVCGKTSGIVIHRKPSNKANNATGNNVIGFTNSTNITITNCCVKDAIECGLYFNNSSKIQVSDVASENCGVANIRIISDCNNIEMVNIVSKDGDDYGIYITDSNTIQLTNIKSIDNVDDNLAVDSTTGVSENIQVVNGIFNGSAGDKGQQEITLGFRLAAIFHQPKRQP